MEVAVLSDYKAMRERCFIRAGGGFGNQLFQYAFARHLRLAHGIPTNLDVSSYFDEQHLSKPHQRLYLQHLDLPIELIRMSAWRYEISRKLHKFPGSVQRAVSGLEFRKEHNRPSPTDISAWKGLVINGAWQKLTHFEGSSIAICDEIRRGIGHVKASEDVKHLVSFHVRRGDYLGVDYMAKIDYQRLLDSARRYFHTLSSGPWRFRIFSDDPEWCRTHLLGDDTELHPGGTMIEDFRSISCCGHHVIANSTFSWWAAFLNPSPDKIVCAPKRWMSDRTARQISILPDGWEELDD